MGLSYFICFCFIVITSVRVPPLSLRGYEGWATCGQNSLTGSPQDSLTSFFTQFLFSDLGFSFLWTRVPQLAALALHSSPKVGIVFWEFLLGILKVLFTDQSIYNIFCTVKYARRILPVKSVIMESPLVLHSIDVFGSFPEWGKARPGPVISISSSLLKPLYVNNDYSERTIFLSTNCISFLVFSS